MPLGACVEVFCVECGDALVWADVGVFSGVTVSSLPLVWPARARPIAEPAIATTTTAVLTA